MKDYSNIREVLISKEEISNRVRQLAAQISADYRDKNPVLVGVLKGGWVYLADLVREMDIDCEVDFISASSYGKGTTTCGSVKLLKDLTEDVCGRHVLIVEDIIDSGITLSHLKKLIEEKKTPKAWK